MRPLLSTLFAFFVCDTVQADCIQPSVQVQCSSSFTSFLPNGDCSGNDWSVNGGSGTFWFTESSPAWVKLDLGSQYSVTKVELYWWFCYAAQEFKVQSSNDGITWSTFYGPVTKAYSQNREDTVDVTPASSFRYIRIYMTTKPTASCCVDTSAGSICKYGYGMRRVLVYTPCTLAPTKTPTETPTKAPTNAPTTQQPTKAPTNAPTTKQPTKAPTNAPTSTPSNSPTRSPTTAPSFSPSSSPTESLCRAGRFMSSDRTECLPCPTSTHRKAPGAEALGDCISCAEGTFAAEGSTDCGPLPFSVGSISQTVISRNSTSLSLTLALLLEDVPNDADKVADRFRIAVGQGSSSQWAIITKSSTSATAGESTLQLTVHFEPLTSFPEIAEDDYLSFAIVDESVLGGCFCGPSQPLLTGGAPYGFNSTRLLSQVVSCNCHFSMWMYLSSGCPEGQFGKDATKCTDCSTKPCSVCPGGNRFWPKQGCWNYDDKSLPVQCSPEEACPGGYPKACTEGYEGWQCSDCAPNYFRKGKAAAGGTCEPCDGEGAGLQTVLLWTSLGTFVFLLLLAIVIFPNPKLDFAAVFLSVCQQLVQVVAQAGPKMPEPLKSLAPYASILTFDLSSIRPECSSLAPLLAYYTELAASSALLLVFIPLAGVASLLRACHGRWKRRRAKASLLASLFEARGEEAFQDQAEWDDPASVADSADKDNSGEAPPSGLRGSLQSASDDEEEHMYRDETFVLRERTLCMLFCDRFVRSLTILLFLFYLRLSTSALEMVVCRRDKKGEARLEFSPEVLCYSESEHTVVAAFSFLILLLITLGFPLLSFLALVRSVRKMRKEREGLDFSIRKQKEMLEQTERRMGFLYRGLLPGYQYYRISLFFLLLSSAVNSTVLKQLSVKLISYIVAFFFQFVYVLVHRPFKKKRENFITLLTGLGKGSFVLVLLALEDDFRPLAFTIALLVLLSGFALFVVVRRKRANDVSQPTNTRHTPEAARPAAEMAKLPKAKRLPKTKRSDKIERLGLHQRLL